MSVSVPKSPVEKHRLRVAWTSNTDVRFYLEGGGVELVLVGGPRPYLRIEGPAFSWAATHTKGELLGLRNALTKALARWGKEDHG
jgi:hypothetical protein